MPYRSRVVDAELRDALASAGAVLIEGPKACGKTDALAEHIEVDLVGPGRQKVDASLRDG